MPALVDSLRGAPFGFDLYYGVNREDLIAVWLMILAAALGCTEPKPVVGPPDLEVIDASADEPDGSGDGSTTLVGCDARDCTLEIDRAVVLAGNWQVIALQAVADGAVRVAMSGSGPLTWDGRLLSDALVGQTNSVVLDILPSGAVALRLELAPVEGPDSSYPNVILTGMASHRGRTCLSGIAGGTVAWAGKQLPNRFIGCSDDVSDSLLWMLAGETFSYLQLDDSGSLWSGLHRWSPSGEALVARPAPIAPGGFTTDGFVRFGSGAADPTRVDGTFDLGSDLAGHEENVLISFRAGADGSIAWAHVDAGSVGPEYSAQACVFRGDHLLTLGALGGRVFPGERPAWSDVDLTDSWRQDKVLPFMQMRDVHAGVAESLQLGGAMDVFEPRAIACRDDVLFAAIHSPDLVPSHEYRSSRGEELSVVLANGEFDLHDAVYLGPSSRALDVVGLASHEDTAAVIVSATGEASVAGVDLSGLGDQRGTIVLFLSW